MVSRWILLVQTKPRWQRKSPAQSWRIFNWRRDTWAVFSRYAGLELSITEYEVGPVAVVFNANYSQDAIHSFTNMFSFREHDQVALHAAQTFVPLNHAINTQRSCFGRHASSKMYANILCWINQNSLTQTSTISYWVYFWGQDFKPFSRWPLLNWILGMFTCS